MEIPTWRRACRLPDCLEHTMTLCPVALAFGCSKCPIVGACPLKTVIGDYKKPNDTPPPAEKK